MYLGPVSVLRMVIVILAISAAISLENFRVFQQIVLRK